MSTIRPRGRPPIPVAASSSGQPVGITPTGARGSSLSRLIEFGPNRRFISSRTCSTAPLRAFPVRVLMSVRPLKRWTCLVDVRKKGRRVQPGLAAPSFVVDRKLAIPLPKIPSIRSMIASKVETFPESVHVGYVALHCATHCAIWRSDSSRSLTQSAKNK